MLLYQCFARVHLQKKKKIKKNKSTNQPSDAYEKLHEINNLIRSQQSNINLKKEKDKILNKIQILEKKVYNESKNLDLDRKLNSDSFYNKKTNNKTS